MFQFCNSYGQPPTLVNGFRTPAGLRNPAKCKFRNPATLVNGFRNPATLVNSFRNLAAPDSGTLPHLREISFQQQLRVGIL